MKVVFEALLVPARISCPVYLKKIDESLGTCQIHVCGNVESVSFEDWHVFLNDEADYLPLPLNPRAEVLIREAGAGLGRPIRGNAVFLGHDANGDATDVPDYLRKLASALFETRWAA